MEERSLVYLAAVLHKIGSFYRLAADGKNVSDETKAWVAMVCPDLTDIAEYLHWTAQFLLENKEGLLGGLSSDEVDKLLTTILQDSNTIDQNIAALLRLAQSFASAGNEAIPVGKGDSLKSIFATIKAESLKSQKGFDLLPLCFERQLLREQGERKGNCGQLWTGFNKAIKRLGQLKNSTIDSLLSLMETYTYCIPSGFSDMNDVSLYEYSKSTASIALGLYDFLAAEENEGKSINSLDDSEEPLLIIGGDLSGIQSFIYDVISKSAAKNLKGRSFYLQLLVDTIVAEISEALSLRKSSVIYSSGGGFYLITANTKFVVQEMKKLRASISARLLEEFGTNLFLASDWTGVSIDLVKNANLSSAWESVMAGVSKRKAQRYSSIICTQSGYQQFFEPSGIGGEAARDVITNEEFAPGEQQIKFEAFGADLAIKKGTNAYIELGRKLRNKLNGLVTYKSSSAVSSGSIRPIASSISYDVETAVGSAVKSLNGEYLAVNEPDYSQLQSQHEPIGFALYGGTDVPRDKKSQVKELEQLAGPESGFRRIAVLRMDVDNLGKLFKSGFDAGQQTFARFSSLSRQLDYFFKGYLDKMWYANADFREWTTILYSGGDDLFLLGKWDVVFKFAQQIRNQFKQWVCNSPAISLSGGTVLVGPKYPISRAAEQSGVAEKLAKGHVCKGQEKNAFTILDYPFNWELEFPMVLELKDQLVHMIGSSKKVNRSLLGKISILYEMKLQQEREGLNPSWSWMMVYDFAKVISDARSREVKEFMNGLQRDIYANSWKGESIKKFTDYHFLDLLRVAARWAELELR